MPIISIEGNIGSGKSTFLQHLKNNNKSDNVIFIDEPVEEWIKIKDSTNKNILELFYEDKEKYSFSFQIVAYITRLRNILETYEKNSDKLIICERSIYTDKNVFAKMLYDEGYIKEIDWIAYNYWFDTFDNKIKLDGIIYINTCPKICHDRVKIRNRGEENTIELDYLIKCDFNHNVWIKNTNIKCLIIEGNKDFKNNEHIIKMFINASNKFTQKALLSSLQDKSCRTDEINYV